MILAEPIAFTLYIYGKFIIRTNLAGPREFELNGLHCMPNKIFEYPNLNFWNYVKCLSH